MFIRPWPAFIFSALLFLVQPGLAWAHGEAPHTPATIWQHWNRDPLLLFGLWLVAAAYLLGTTKLWQRLGPGQGIRYSHVLAFFGGLVALVIALVSPLDGLAETLFSAHMVQHLLLLIVAPPLLVWSRPVIPLLWALPQPARHAVGHGWRQARWGGRAWHLLTQPGLVWALYALTLWLWHLPRLYQAALTNDLIHEVEHVNFLGVGLLFWWLVLQPVGPRRLGYGATILFIFTTVLHSGALGALLTFAQIVLYPIYETRVAAWGLTPLEDQQVAGILMWLPAGFVYVLTALVSLGVWLHQLETRLQRHEAAILSPAVVQTKLTVKPSSPPRLPGQARRRPNQSVWLLNLGTTILLALLPLVLLFDLPAGLNRLVAGEPDVVVEVTARQWAWQVRYPAHEIETLNELHLPTGRPVLIRLSSQDIWHSLSLPMLAETVAVTPDKVQTLYLQIDEVGLYEGQCGDFCGLGQAEMKIRLIAQPPAEFEAWLVSQRGTEPELRSQPVSIQVSGMLE